MCHHTRGGVILQPTETIFLPHELMGPTLALETAWTGKRTRGKYLTDPQEIKELSDYLATLPAEQRQALEEVCHSQILNSRRTDVRTVFTALLPVCRPLLDPAFMALSDGIHPTLLSASPLCFVTLLWGLFSAAAGWEASLRCGNGDGEDD